LSIQLSNGQIDFGTMDQELNVLMKQEQVQTQVLQQAQQPSLFKRMFGAITGVAGLATPGLGALGSLIGANAGGGVDPNQYLQIQKQMSEQSEAFEAVSNVLKSKHESAMSAIQNMKD
jgi:hypothetical protein